MTKDELLTRLRSLIRRIECGDLEVTGEGRMTDTGVSVQSGWTIGNDAITFPRCEPSEEQKFLDELRESFPGIPNNVKNVHKYASSDNVYYTTDWGTFSKSKRGTYAVTSAGEQLEVSGGSWEECKSNLRAFLDPLVGFIRGDEQ